MSLCAIRGAETAPQHDRVLARRSLAQFHTRLAYYKSRNAQVSSFVTLVFPRPPVSLPMSFPFDPPFHISNLTKRDTESCTARNTEGRGLLRSRTTSGFLDRAVRKGVLLERTYIHSRRLPLKGSGSYRAVIYVRWFLHGSYRT